MAVNKLVLKPIDAKYLPRIPIFLMHLLSGGLIRGGQQNADGSVTVNWDYQGAPDAQLDALLAEQRAKVKERASRFTGIVAVELDADGNPI